MAMAERILPEQRKKTGCVPNSRLLLETNPKVQGFDGAVSRSSS
jgi:hypothetical protein